MTIHKMPVFFVGHGNPMNALYDNEYTKSLSAMGASLKEKPKAVLMISAHWQTEGTLVNVSPKPKTIHDFGGFPDELYAIQYPAPGSPDYAREVMNLVPSIQEDTEWGLDHGAWATLRHIFPKADVPVFQLSIARHQSAQYHFELGQKLKPLRNKGVLIVGSGNIVHNLRLWFARMDMSPYDWAVEFDEWVKKKINERDFQSLIDYKKQGEAAKLSVPTDEHYLPLLYCLGMTDKEEDIAFTYEEVSGAGSMRCLRIG